MSANTPYRLAGLAGLISGVLLFFAAARRGGLVPENSLTHAMAPPSSALALLALTGLYLWQRERTGTLGLLGYAVNFLGLAGLFAVEFATHGIFPYLDETTRTALLAGPTRGYFLVVAGLFLIGVLLFGVASWRARVLPGWAIALYTVGFVPAALRGQVPEAVYLGGLVVGGFGTLGLSWALWRGAAGADRSPGGQITHATQSAETSSDTSPTTKAVPETGLAPVEMA